MAITLRQIRSVSIALALPIAAGASCAYDQTLESGVRLVHGLAGAPSATAIPTESVTTDRGYDCGHAGNPNADADGCIVSTKRQIATKANTVIGGTTVLQQGAQALVGLGVAATGAGQVLQGVAAGRAADALQTTANAAAAGKLTPQTNITATGGAGGAGGDANGNNSGNTRSTTIDRSINGCGNITAAYGGTISGNPAGGNSTSGFGYGYEGSTNAGTNSTTSVSPGSCSSAGKPMSFNYLNDQAPNRYASGLGIHSVNVRLQAQLG